MNSKHPEIKLTHRIVSATCHLERLTGILATSIATKESENLRMQALQRNALGAICLDQTSPAPLSHPILSFFTQGISTSFNTNSPLSKENLEVLANTKNAFALDFELSEEGIIKIYQCLTADASGADQGDPFRVTSTAFLSHDNKRLFTTVSPFLVKRRFKEIVEWVSEELAKKEVAEPLLIATFHLLMLQLHPFKTANHSLALIVTWHLLKDCGYVFVERASFIDKFLLRADHYLNAIKHAERSTYSDWSTTPLWLEFFIKSLAECAEDALRGDESIERKALLSSTQRQILDIVKTHGAVTRERVVSETGINLSTVKYNLSLLASRGHLKREGGGRSTFYKIS